MSDPQLPQRSSSTPQSEPDHAADQTQTHRPVPPTMDYAPVGTRRSMPVGAIVVIVLSALAILLALMLDHNNLAWRSKADAAKLPTAIEPLSDPVAAPNNDVSAALFMLVRTVDVAPDVFICPATQPSQANPAKTGSGVDPKLPLDSILLPKKGMGLP